MIRWFFEPVPLGRVAALRTLAYLFAPVDVLVLTRWVLPHKDVPGELYQPLLVGRILHLPTPSYWLVVGVAVALLACALVAATGRAPRTLGIARRNGWPAIASATSSPPAPIASIPRPPPVGV